MKIALIVIGVIAMACIAIEIASKISAKREKARWDKLSPDEQRKYQEQMYIRSGLLVFRHRAPKNVRKALKLSGLTTSRPVFRD